MRTKIPTISPTGRKLLTVLDGRATASNRDLARLCGCHERTVQKALEGLTAKKYITITRVTPTGAGDPARNITVLAKPGKVTDAQ